MTDCINKRAPKDDRKELINHVTEVWPSIENAKGEADFEALNKLFDEGLA